MIKCEIKDYSKQEGKGPFNGTGNGAVEIKGDFGQILNETGMLIFAVIETLSLRIEKGAPANIFRDDKEGLEIALLHTIENAAIHFLACNKGADTTIDMSKLRTFLNNQRGGNDDD